MELRETGCEGVDQSHLGQDREQWGGGGPCEHCTEPLGSIKGGEFGYVFSFSRRTLLQRISYGLQFNAAQSLQPSCNFCGNFMSVPLR